MVTSCYRNRDKVWPDGPLDLYIWVIDQVCGQNGWILAKFFFCVFMDETEMRSVN